MKLLVFDVGTSSTRGALFDEGASLLAYRQIKYQPVYAAGGQVSQPPSDWLDALKAICRELSPLGVDALALSAQRSSLIPAAADGTPLADAIMWQDTRNRTLCRSLGRFDARIRSLSGAGINTVCSGGKMAWLRQERPELYGAAAHLFVIADYLIFQMTGRHVTDHSYGSRSLLMDLRRREWSEELLELFQIDREKLGTLIAPGSVAGELTAAFAAETGLRPDIPVISCGGDQQCGALGQGVFRQGEVSVNFGTGAFLLAPTDAVPEPLPAGLVCGAFAVPGRFMLEASLLSCGSAVDWFLKTFCDGADASFAGVALRQSPPGANGVLALPYFQGRAFPDWNYRARASFHGLRPGSSRADLLRALLESLCVEVQQALQALPVRPERIRFSGGLSRTEELCRLLADVTGLPVLCTDDGDATLRGAWMNAACCLSLAGDYEAAWAAARPGGEREYLPRWEQRGVYEQLSARAEALYAALNELREVESDD